MNIRELDFGLLQCFTTLMSERSVSKSALRLGMSQPAVSHALARLRRLFDDPLLIKNRGGMTPTTRAIELDPEIRALLSGAEHLLRRSPDFSPENSRVRFTIMSPEFVEYLVAPLLMTHIEAHAPGIDIAFRTSDPEHAPHWLESGEIDIRLGWLTAPPPLLRFKLLFRDSFACIARLNHPHLKNRITPAQFIEAAHARIELPRTQVSSEAVDRAVAARGARLRIALQAQNANTLAHAVARSNLISTLPVRLARAMAAQLPLQVLPMPLEVPDARIAMYWHERTHKQPAHRWFRQLITETARAL